MTNLGAFQIIPQDVAGNLVCILLGLLIVFGS